MAFMSCGYKHKLPNLCVDGNAAWLLCVYVCVSVSVHRYKTDIFRVS